MGRRDASLVCVNGHEYTPENTLWGTGSSGKPQKSCRKCKSIRDRHRYQNDLVFREKKKAQYREAKNRWQPSVKKANEKVT